MASKKFSQIVSATAPALTDTVVGVQGGTTDVQYTFSQVRQTSGGLPIVSQDPRFDGFELALYVATTGNDSNPGTLAQPYLTIQRAINEAVRFSYENQYSLTITVAAGTYTITSPIVVTELFYTGAFGLGSISGAGIGQTIIVTSGFSSFQPAITFQSTAMADWNIFGVTIDHPFHCIRLFGTADCFADQVEFKDSTGGSSMVPFFVQDYGILEAENITVSTTTFLAFIQCRFNSQGFFLQGITLPATCTVGGAFIDALQGSTIQFTPTSITNSGGVTGPKLNLAEQSGVWTNNGLLSDIPGSTTGYVDVSSVIASQNAVFPFSSSTKASFFAQQFAGIPANTDISPGCWTVVKDTSGGGVYVLYNDAGTIKKVALV